MARVRDTHLVVLQEGHGQVAAELHVAVLRRRGGVLCQLAGAAWRKCVRALCSRPAGSVGGLCSCGFIQLRL
jgi:hypothetical protein